MPGLVDINTGEVISGGHDIVAHLFRHCSGGKGGGKGRRKIPRS